jgi:hypothetical protein
MNSQEAVQSAVSWLREADKTGIQAWHDPELYVLDETHMAPLAAMYKMCTGMAPWHWDRKEADDDRIIEDLYTVCMIDFSVSIRGRKLLNLAVHRPYIYKWSLEQTAKFLEGYLEEKNDE